MNKLIALLGLLMVAAETYAGTCSSRTVEGLYTFNLSSTGNGTSSSFFDAGRLYFNGTSAVSVGGIESQDGLTRSIAVIGTYSVSIACVLTATFTIGHSTPLDPAKTFSLWVFLDRLDIAPAINVAYHGNAVFRTSNGASGTGAIDKVNGKF